MDERRGVLASRKGPWRPGIGEPSARRREGSAVRQESLP